MTHKIYLKFSELEIKKKKETEGREELYRDMEYKKFTFMRIIPFEF